MRCFTRLTRKQDFCTQVASLSAQFDFSSLALLPEFSNPLPTKTSPSKQPFSYAYCRFSTRSIVEWRLLATYLPPPLVSRLLVFKMVGSPMRNSWVDDGKLALNPPARLLDQSSQWIPSTVGPLANTIKFPRPACEADRDNRRNGPDSNDTNETRGAKRKRQEIDGTISLEIVPPARSARHLALVPEFENTRQRSMFQPRKLYPPFPRTCRVANLTATRHDLLSSPRCHRPHPTKSQLPLPRPLNTSTQRGNTVGKSSLFHLWLLHYFYTGP